MCAIYGSASREEFIKLYELNKDRGGFAFSFCGIKNHDIYVFKNKLPDSDLFYQEDWDYYLAHDQAPTGSVRKYSEKTSHPFHYGRWYVAHNGVLTNYTEVLDPTDTKEIDSSYIAAYMEQLDLLPIPPEENHEIFYETFSAFKGTHACWVWDEENSKLFLTKNGSTLFTKGDTFSSVQFEGSKPLLDGWAYQMFFERYASKHNPGYGVIEIVKFEDSNPFAVIDSSLIL
jgi:predicted glutamine amidotransferase